MSITDVRRVSSVMKGISRLQLPAGLELREAVNRLVRRDASDAVRQIVGARLINAGFSRGYISLNQLSREYLDLRLQDCGVYEAVVGRLRGPLEPKPEIGEIKLPPPNRIESFISAEDIPSLPAPEIQRLTAQHISALGPLLREFTWEQLGAFPPAALAALPADTLAQMLSSRLPSGEGIRSAWSAAGHNQLCGLTAFQFAGFRADQISPAVMGRLGAGQLRLMPPRLMAQLPADCLAALPKQARALLTVGQLQALTTGQIEALAARPLRLLSDSFFYPLTDFQFSAFDAGQLSALTRGLTGALAPDQLIILVDNWAGRFIRLAPDQLKAVAGELPIAWRLFYNLDDPQRSYFLNCLDEGQRDHLARALEVQRESLI